MRLFQRLPIVLLTVVVLAGVASSRADDNFPWRRTTPDRKEIAEQVRLMVGNLMTGNDVKDPPKSDNAQTDLYRIVRGYAMMQALPYLARLEYRKADGTIGVLDPDTQKFDAAKRYAQKIQTFIHEKAHADTLDDTSAETVRKGLLGDKVQDYHRTNYAVPLVLAFLDSAYTGGLDFGSEGFSTDKDRRARSAESPGAPGRRAVARLTSLVIAREIGDFGANDTNPPPLNTLWHYDNCCLNKSDMSVNGLAPLALRASVNLDLLSYDKDAFEFPFASGGLLGRDAFRARLVDVLIHVVLTLAEASNQRVFASEDYADWQGRPDRAPGNPVDIRNYRTDPASDKVGIPIRRVVELTGSKQATPDPKQATLYYYDSLTGPSGAYYCANAAFALCTCANLLVALLEKTPGVVLGKACPIQPAPPSAQPVAASTREWSATVKAGAFRLSLADRGRYTRLIVKKGGTDIGLDDRIARAFAMITRLMAEPDGPKNYYKLRTDPSLSLSKNDVQHRTWLGLHWFSVMKACMATRQHEYDLGPWNWYDSLIEQVIVPQGGKFKDEEGTPDFLILAVTRSYRSIYSIEK